MSSGLGWYLDTIGRVPLLTPAEEIELGTAIRAWQDHPDGPDSCPAGIRRRGIKARDRFVHANLRLAVNYISTRCQRLLRSADEDDVIQAANLGLMRAVERFDPTRGYKFSTYAYWWIMQSVNRFADTNNLISRPAHHGQLLGRLAKAARELQQTTGQAPSREQLAHATGISINQIGDLLQGSRSCVSLDQLVGDDVELGNLLAAVPAADHSIERELVLNHLAALPEADRELVSLLHGLNGPVVPAAEVALLLGFASAREVNARKCQALQYLRQRQERMSWPQPDIEQFSHRIGSQLGLEITGDLQVSSGSAGAKRGANFKRRHASGVGVEQPLLDV